MQIWKDTIFEGHVKTLDGLCANASFGIKIAWSWGVRITTGSTNHACTDGRMEQGIFGIRIASRQQYSISIGHRGVNNTRQ